MNMIPQLAHPRHLPQHQQFGSPGFAVPPFEPLHNPRRNEQTASLPRPLPLTLRSARTFATSSTTPSPRAYPLYDTRRAGLARESSNEGAFRSPYNDPSEHMLRRKTPNGTLAAGYDGTPVQWSSKPPALKHLILPFSGGSASRTNNYSPAASNDPNSWQRPEVSGWAYQQTPQYGGMNTGQVDLRGSGEAEKWSQLSTLPAASYNPWENIDMQQTPTYYHMNSSQIPTVLQPSYQPSPGPTASNDGGLYGPYWPDGRYVPYRPAATRAPGGHNVNQNSYPSQNLQGHSHPPLELLPPFRPPPISLKTEPVHSVGNSSYNFPYPENSIHGHEQRYNTPTQLNPLRLEGSLYPSNSEGSRTPTAESTNRANNNHRFPEKTLSWAHTIYVDLLAYLQQAKRESRLANPSQSSKAYSKTSIYPKPPRQPVSYLGTSQWVGMNGDTSDANNARRSSKISRPTPRQFVNREYNSWPGDSSGQIPQLVSTNQELGPYASPFQSLNHQSGSPLSRAKEALDLLTSLCEQSGWYWIDGMLLGGCLAYGLEQFHNALDWYSKIIAIDPK